MAEQDDALVVALDDEESALGTARELVTNGVGADVVLVPANDESPARWEVRTITDDLVRACEVLGIEPPEVDDAPPGGPPWKLILAVWLVAMVVIPLAAFWLTVRIST